MCVSYICIPPIKNHSGVCLEATVSTALRFLERNHSLHQNPYIRLYFCSIQTQSLTHLSYLHHMLILWSRYFVTLLFLSSKTFSESWRERDRIWHPLARNTHAQLLLNLHVSTILIYICTDDLVYIHSIRIPIPHLNPRNRKSRENTCIPRHTYNGLSSSSISGRIVRLS